MNVDSNWMEIFVWGSRWTALVSGSRQGRCQGVKRRSGDRAFGRFWMRNCGYILYIYMYINE
jgi:hypothetical protein